MYTYILDFQTGKVKLTNNLYEWAEWYCSVDQSKLVIAETEIRRKGRVLGVVETKFSGQVESLTAVPLVWITQFTGSQKEVWRTDSPEKARSNHKRMVSMLNKALT